MALTHMLDVQVAMQMVRDKGLHAVRTGGRLEIIGNAGTGSLMIADGFIARRNFDDIVAELLKAPAAK